MIIKLFQLLTGSLSIAIAILLGYIFYANEYTLFATSPHLPEEIESMTIRPEFVLITLLVSGIMNIVALYQVLIYKYLAGRVSELLFMFRDFSWCIHNKGENVMNTVTDKMVEINDMLGADKVPLNRDYQYKSICLRKVSQCDNYCK